MIVIVECLLVSHEVARAFLTDHRAPSSSDSTLVPFIVKQETESLKCALEILLELYVDKSSMKANDAEVTEAKLLSVLDNVLTYFLGITSKSQQESWTSLLTVTFENVSNLPEDKFRITLPVLFNQVCDILSVQTISQDLRMSLCKMLKRVGNVYGIVKPVENHC